MRYRIKEIMKTNAKEETDTMFIIQKRFLYFFWVHCPVDYICDNGGLYLKRYYIYKDLDIVNEIIDELNNPVYINYKGHVIKRIRNDYYNDINSKYFYPITSIYNYDFGFLHYPKLFQSLEKAKEYIDKKLISKTKVSFINPIAGNK